MTAGRPFRFLGGVAVAWIGVRAALLWPDGASVPEVLRQVAPVRAAAAAAAVPEPPPAGRARAPRPLAVGVTPAPRPHARAGPTPPPAAPLVMLPVRLPVAAVPSAAGAVAQFPPPAGVLVPPPAAPPRGRRWSVSAWGIARDGRGLGAGPQAPQLGGAQAGIRVDRALGGGFAGTARLATPAAGAGREAALGLAWRPAGVPVRFVAEYRFALDGTRGGPALGASGGVSGVALPLGVALEAYGQAGVIRRARTEPYVDASARAARRLAEVGPVALDAGVGAWGGAQRGTDRLDVGPSIGARVGVAGGALRLSLDWRQRIAGNARPGSGPALTLGADL